MGEDGIDEFSENSGLVAAEMATADQVDRGLGFGLVVVVPMRAVPAAALGDLGGRQAEEEEVLFSRLLGHLDGGAVTGADGERAIHHELHIAGPAGFEAGG